MYMRLWLIVPPPSVAQVCELQQQHGRVRTFGHGQVDGCRPGSVRTGQRVGLLGEQLRGRADKIVRIQKVPGPHPEDRGFRVPGRQFARRLPWTVPQLAVQVPLVRLRRHRRIRLPAQPSLQSHTGRHTGNKTSILYIGFLPTRPEHRCTD